MANDMTNEKAKEIMKCWYLNGTEGMTDERLGYIEGWFNKEDKLAFELAIKALEGRPKGKWILKSKDYDSRAMRMYGTFQCSACEMYEDFYEHPDDMGEYLTSNYCKWCGAAMRDDLEDANQWMNGRENKNEKDTNII